MGESITPKPGLAVRGDDGYFWIVRHVDPSGYVTLERHDERRGTRIAGVRADHWRRDVTTERINRG